LNESEEVALVRRCQAGDIESFRKPVGQYRSTLFGTAYLMLRDRGLAEDAVQEALIQMWKHIRSVCLQRSLKAWLIRIVVNEVNQQRRKRRVPTIPLEEVPNVSGDPDEAETVAVRSEERQSLKRALEMLLPEQQEAIYFKVLF
jgi:RNA polymerase sigma-70 factor (ECF subfamily)